MGVNSEKKILFLGSPPMHEQCAEFASKICPFVSGNRQEYSSRPVNPTVVRTEEMASAIRPKQMYILRTRTKKVGFVNVNGSRLIQAWIWSRVREIPVERTDV